jgi:hypothetical protein
VRPRCLCRVAALQEAARVFSSQSQQTTQASRATDSAAHGPVHAGLPILPHACFSAHVHNSNISYTPPSSSAASRRHPHDSTGSAGHRSRNSCSLTARSASRVPCAMNCDTFSRPLAVMRHFHAHHQHQLRSFTARTSTLASVTAAHSLARDMLTFCRGLHAHHSIEDATIFPFLAPSAISATSRRIMRSWQTRCTRWRDWLSSCGH